MKKSPTGRILKSARPNLQNIPVRTKESRIIREAFNPTKWCYGSGEDSEGAELEVEVVDIGPDGNATMKRLSEDPTNLSELGF